jgi:hypothetical protein
LLGSLEDAATPIGAGAGGAVGAGGGGATAKALLGSLED